MDESSLYGKIPYIWLVDEDNNLHRAAMPNVWVVSCQERLDFWNYLQEIGDSKSKQGEAIKITSDKDSVEFNAQLDQEREKIVAEAQEEAITLATQRLISALLDDEELQLDNLTDNGIKTDESKEHEVDQTIKKQEETKPPSSREAWIETENCTSCNECTDKYPNIFKYNADKLAYIDNPSGGTFEDLVKAAEKCPAACIHPGLPSNSSEKNLEKLISRALKFN